VKAANDECERKVKSAGGGVATGVAGRAERESARINAGPQPAPVLWWCAATGADDVSTDAEVDLGTATSRGGGDDDGGGLALMVGMHDADDDSDEAGAAEMGRSGAGSAWWGMGGEMERTGLAAAAAAAAAACGWGGWGLAARGGGGKWMPARPDEPWAAGAFEGVGSEAKEEDRTGMDDDDDDDEVEVVEVVEGDGGGRRREVWVLLRNRGMGTDMLGYVDHPIIF
jgi:hypothetical protein